MCGYPGCLLSVQFYSLEGKFCRVGEPKVFASEAEALVAVRAYAEAGGYTNVRVADDAGDDGVRFVARTPGGRSGRNVAQGDWIPSGDSE